MNDSMVATHNIGPINPSQPRWIYAALRRDKNNRSPLVVSRPKIPFLGLPPGFFFSQTVMAIKQQAIKIKKAAVCHVHAIHVINSKSKKPFSWVFATESQELAAYNLVKIILFLMQIL
jgi:hypothetical protein